MITMLIAQPSGRVALLEPSKGLTAKWRIASGRRVTANRHSLLVRSACIMATRNRDIAAAWESPVSR